MYVCVYRPGRRSTAAAFRGCRVYGKLEALRRGVAHGGRTGRHGLREEHIHTNYAHSHTLTRTTHICTCTFTRTLRTLCWRRRCACVFRRGERRMLRCTLRLRRHVMGSLAVDTGGHTTRRTFVCVSQCVCVCGRWCVRRRRSRAFTINHNPNIRPFWFSVVAFVARAVVGVVLCALRRRRCLLACCSRLRCALVHRRGSVEETHVHTVGYTNTMHTDERIGVARCSVQCGVK